MEIAEAFVKIRPDTKDFGRDLEKGVERPVTSAASRFGKLIAGFGFAKTLKDASTAAANLRDEQDKTTAVFKGSSAEVLKFSKTTATAYGISERAALNATGSFGNLLTSFGTGRKKAADMSITLTRLAGDLSSFNGTSVEEAITAIRAGLSGETEPLKRFGIALDDVTLKNKALALGLTTTATGVLPPGIRAQAAYAVILERSKNAQGDFARTSDSAANKLKVAKASAEQAAAALGTTLLPVTKRVADAVTFLAKGFAGLPSSIQLATVAGLGFLVFGDQIKRVVDGTKSLLKAVAGIPARFGAAREAGQGFTSALLGSVGVSGGLAAVSLGLTAGITALTLWSAAKKKAKQETLDFAKALSDDKGKIDDNTLSIVKNHLAQHNQTDNLAKAKVSQEQLTRALQAGTNEQIKHALALAKVKGGILGSAGANRVLIGELEGSDNAYAKLLVKLAQADQLDQGLVDTLSKYVGTYSKATQLNKDSAKVFDDTGEATKGLTEKVDDQKTAYQELSETIDKFTQQLAESLDPQLAAEAAQSDFNESLKSLGDTLKETGPNMDLNSEKGRQLGTAFRDTIGRAEALTAALAKNGSISKDQAVIRDNEIRQLQRIQQEYPKLAPLVQPYIDKLKKIPTKKETELKVKKKAAEDALAGFRKLLDSFNHFDFRLGVNGVSGLKRIFGLGTRAAGGPVTAGEPYVVGEKRPELFVPDRNGTIIPSVSKNGSKAVGNTIAYGPFHFHNYAAKLSQSDVVQAMRSIEFLYG